MNSELRNVISNPWSRTSAECLGTNGGSSSKLGSITPVMTPQMTSQVTSPMSSRMATQMTNQMAPQMTTQMTPPLSSQMKHPSFQVPPGGRLFPDTGSMFSVPPPNSSVSGYGPGLKCMECYGLGAELYYTKVQYQYLEEKFKNEVESHSMCGPKILNLELKLDDYMVKEQMLEKETRDFRDKCKKLETEVDKLKEICRSSDELIYELRGKRLSSSISIKQEPDAAFEGNHHSNYDPTLGHIFSVHRKSQEPRNGRHHPSDSRDFKTRMPPNRGAREMSHEMVSSEGARANVKSRYAVKEKQGDLFDMPGDYALAHCVGSDFIMSSGVAIKFRKQFRNVPELLEQNKNPGEVAFLNHSGRRVYYLVTKQFSTGKPSWEDFQKAVVELRILCLEHDVKKLAIPKIGCGRDQLDWMEVRKLLNDEFSATGIEITVCVIQQENLPEKRWNLKLVQSLKPCAELDPTECALLFVASKDGIFTPAMESLNQKYNFKADFSAHPKALGSLYHFSARNNVVNIFGLLIKERHTDPFSFTRFSECLIALKRVMKKMHMFFIGMEAFDDSKFRSVNRKMWTVFIDSFFVDEFEVYICWPNYISEKPWEEKK